MLQTLRCSFEEYNFTTDTYAIHEIPFRIQDGRTPRLESWSMQSHAAGPRQVARSDSDTGLPELSASGTACRLRTALLAPDPCRSFRTSFFHSFLFGESRLELKESLMPRSCVRSQANHRGDVSRRQGQLGNRGREMT